MYLFSILSGLLPQLIWLPKPALLSTTVSCCCPAVSVRKPTHLCCHHHLGKRKVKTKTNIRHPADLKSVCTDHSGLLKLEPQTDTDFVFLIIILFYFLGLKCKLFCAVFPFFPHSSPQCCHIMPYKNTLGFDVIYCLC